MSGVYGVVERDLSAAADLGKDAVLRRGQKHGAVGDAGDASQDGVRFFVFSVGDDAVFGREGAQPVLRGGEGIGVVTDFEQVDVTDLCGETGFVAALVVDIAGEENTSAVFLHEYAHGLVIFADLAVGGFVDAVENGYRKVAERERLGARRCFNRHIFRRECVNHLVVDFLVVPLYDFLVSDFLAVVYLEIGSADINVAVGNHGIKAADVVGVAVCAEDEIEVYTPVRRSGMGFEIVED